MSGNGGMTPEEVKSYIERCETDKYKTTPTAKAIMKGTRLGEKSGAGGHVESSFRPPKSGRRD